MSTYVIYPVRGSVVTGGQTVAAGTAWSSGEQARALVALLNPDATGTACSWIGNEVFPGDIAGEHLDVAQPVNRRRYSFREVGLPTPSSMYDCYKVARPGRVFKFRGEYRDVVDMTTEVGPDGQGWCIVTTHCDSPCKETTLCLGPIPLD